MSVKPEITLDSIFEDYQKEEFVSKDILLSRFEILSNNF